MGVWRGGEPATATTYSKNDNVSDTVSSHPMLDVLIVYTIILWYIIPAIDSFVRLLSHDSIRLFNFVLSDLCRKERYY